MIIENLGSNDDNLKESNSAFAAHAGIQKTQIGNNGIARMIML
jgi:hypothetical protein